MKNLFFDTNVIIDFLADRAPFSRQAADLFEKALGGEIKVFVSSLCFNNVYYIIRKAVGHDAAIHKLTMLSSFTEVLSVPQSVIKLALSSGNSDFEDAVQYYTAISDQSIEGIVTRDKKGFANSQLPVLLPLEALLLVSL